ncbi:alkaline phosphatase family protein [Scleromatobacter humisilvae]|uniref:Alkaline phosphatase family protein n=1 Tax=Scleromatobacter humisilvae TaxID=2897159 RepID=A0A9X1YMS0_9BURK|nr:alkaline phosphatase family protein [Scleromatobacter humisilvae]MCK9684381.1 alkaline phosphatase family protein [Scleromatobacter humisilvae]
MKSLLVGTALLSSTALCLADDHRHSIDHVLIVSIDGMHQQDLARCISDKTCPNIAALARHGVTYTNAYTPGLSDSVPGLAALVTGGGPRSTGLFYDDVYDRTLYAGTDTHCTGTQGVEVFLQEQVGIDAMNGGALVHLDGGGAFNPQQIPHRKVGGKCVPVYPHDFIQTNTIFEVAKQNLRHAHTAWSDKHAWGTDWVNGPSGKGVDDMARTEINSIDGPAGNDFTGSYDGIAPAYLHTEVFDDIHVENILNEIDGKDSAGKTPAPVPTIFGTNFQTLSVAQKATNLSGGGYADAAFTPNPFVKDAIAYVDAAIGKFSAALAARHLSDSTLFVLTAKHGQSPADHARLKKIGHAVGTTLTAYVGGGSDPVTGNNLGNGQVTDDDVAFVWLNDPSQRAAAEALLAASTACPPVDPTTRTVVAVVPRICADNGGAVIDLGAMPWKFGDPANGRTPDFMVQPNPGVIYTTSQAKDMEHGGFAPDDGHLALVVSHPSLRARTVDSRVTTAQVAPTAIRALGLDPRLLESVRKEGTRVLPHALSEYRDDDDN